MRRLKFTEKLGLKEQDGDYPIDLELFLNIHAEFMNGKSKLEESPEFLQGVPNVFMGLMDRNCKADDV
jgi:hypothetical protein